MQDALKTIEDRTVILQESVAFVLGKWNQVPDIHSRYVFYKHPVTGAGLAF